MNTFTFSSSNQIQKVKYLLLLFTFCFLSTYISAQTTAIPDINFEQALVDQGIDSDGVVNGEVEFSIKVSG